MPRLYENKAFYHYPNKPTKKKNDYGEYTVKAFDHAGKRVTARDYVTDDYDDAVATHGRLAGKKYNIKTSKEI